MAHTKPTAPQTHRQDQDDEAQAGAKNVLLRLDGRVIGLGAFLHHSRPVGIGKLGRQGAVTRLPTLAKQQPDQQDSHDITRGRQEKGLAVGQREAGMQQGDDVEMHQHPDPQADGLTDIGGRHQQIKDRRE